MSNRHLSRIITLQTLFNLDFLNFPEEKFKDILDYNLQEFGVGTEDKDFAIDLMNKVLKKRETLDDIIIKAAPQWPLNKISPVDRNVLRIGLAELLFSDRENVPPKVAINEAIELGKSFGGQNSGKFVSGVLGAVYKEMGEPGKDQKSKKQKEDIPLEEMKIEKKGGAVIYTQSEQGIEVALVHNIFGFWTLPKGSLDDGLEVKDGIVKKMKEKVGLDISLERELDNNEYVAHHPEEGKVRRQVTYYIAKSEKMDIVLDKESKGLDDAKWFKLQDIIDLKFYDDIIPIITKAVKILSDK